MLGVKTNRNIVKIRSRHPSHSQFRGKFKSPVPAIVRFGSVTDYPLAKIEINPVEAVKISSSKLLMKQKFKEANVRTAEWFTATTIKEVLAKANENYPVIAKSHFGSRGRGNTKLNTEKELESWLVGKTLSNYIFEFYYSYNKEYRLHVTKDGCFYTCRKMLMKQYKDKPNSWQRHDDNCVWILETNPLFEKPSCWDKIISDCVKALTVINADILAFDIRVQNEVDKEGIKRKEVDYILIECNSAPSCHGNVVSAKYMEIIPKLINDKYNEKIQK